MTTARKTLPGTATAPLVYWLLLVCGLAVLTVARIDTPHKVLPLWVGAVAGTALGQALARFRLRLWLALFIVVNATWLGAIVWAPLWLSFWSQRSVWDCVALTLTAFAPAAMCGYFSLSERGGLLAFWFPSVPWMLAILDDAEPAILEGVQGWGLLAVLGALMIGFFHARETRRVALWKGYALDPLATPRGEAVLREAPLRPAAPFVWVAGLGAATLVLTGWIAPLLWQKEKAPPRGANHGAAAGTEGSSSGCCPEPAPAETRRERVREYFDVLHAHDDRAFAPPPAPCIPCANGKPIPRQSGATASGGPSSPAGGTGTPVGSASPAPARDPATVQDPAPVRDPHPARAPGPTQASPPLPATAAPISPPPQPIATARKPAAPAPPPAALPAPPPPGKPVAVRTVRVAPVAAAAPAPIQSGSPLRGLLALAGVMVAALVALRPLRRLVTVRHLRRPLWAEGVDQRVSNLWELALIGLRDVGFHPAPGEQPQALARRVGLPALATCAGVLERARHGVRVDAADLEAMRRAAEAAYAEARRRAGWAGRAAGWLRWPLA